MLFDIFVEIEDFYHQKTFDKSWISECGNGNKKLDEIQVFLKFLQNKKEHILSVEDFDQNFKYKEGDVPEPGDLEYKSQIYQITHGKPWNYSRSQRCISHQIKKQESGYKPEASLIPAHDYALHDDERLKLYLSDLGKKSGSASNDIILLVRYDHRISPESDLKATTRWRDVIFVFDDKNLSVKS